MQNYLTLFLMDPLFFKALSNSYILSEIVSAAAFLSAVLLLLAVKKTSRQAKLILGSVLTVLFAIFLLYSVFYSNSYGLIINKPFGLLSQSISFIFSAICTIGLFLGISGVMILISTNEKILSKKCIQYSGIMMVTFLTFLYSQLTVNALGIPQTAYAAYTLTTHLSDYAPAFNSINSMHLLLIAQIGLLNCFIYWLVGKIIKKMKGGTG